jgi:superoxide dismutase, Cu-Zn family
MRSTVLPALAVFAGLAAPAAAQEATASFIDQNGQVVGTASLRQAGQGVLITVDLKGLPAGEHAIHVHLTGRCDPASKFESAGGHFAVDDQKHGYLAEGGPHGGDMPNQRVGADGALMAEIYNTGIALGAGSASVFDEDGSAIVVHAKADDYRSQPAGAAGDRLACAVIEKR